MGEPGFPLDLAVAQSFRSAYEWLANPPLAELVDEFFRYVSRQHKDAVAVPKDYAVRLIDGFEAFLTAPSPVMLGLLVIMSVLIGGWMSGRFADLVRRHERVDGDEASMLPVAIHLGLGVGAALVLGVNLVLHAVARAGIPDALGVLASRAHAGLGLFAMPGDFTLAASLLLYVTGAAAWRTGLLEVAGDGWRLQRRATVATGFVVGLVAGYPVAYAFYWLLWSVGAMWLMLGLFVLLSTLAGGWRLGLFAALGLGLIKNLGLWPESMETLALVAASALVCVLIGLPLGIAMSRSTVVTGAVRPALDLMQTMPAYVYLIPAVIFFGIGAPPALLATVMFALPPIVRLTAHGIHQVDGEVVEASDAFGATGWQALMKAQVPLARSDIMVGMNQMLLLSLSMVVIAAAVGAGGLGAIVYTGLTQLEVGQGFEGGISIVILAVLIDRVTQALGKEPGAVTESTFAGVLKRMRDVAARTFLWRARRTRATK